MSILGHGCAIFCQKRKKVAVLAVESEKGFEVFGKVWVGFRTEEKKEKNHFHSIMVCGEHKRAFPHTIKREVTMDFASYTPKGGKKQEELPAEVQDVQGIVDAFRGKTDTEMLKAIYERAVEGKRNGTLTNEQIDAFYAQLSPLLDGMRRKRLQKIVEELKRL